MIAFSWPHSWLKRDKDVVVFDVDDKLLLVLRLEQVVVGFRQVVARDHFGVVAEHQRVEINRRPIPFGIVKIIVQIGKLRRHIGRDQIALAHRCQRRRDADRNVELTRAGLRLGEDPADHRGAAEADEIGANKRIFLAEGIEQRFAVLNVHGRVKNQRAFFLCAFDDRRFGGRSAAQETADRWIEPVESEVFHKDRFKDRLYLVCGSVQRVSIKANTIYRRAWS